MKEEKKKKRKKNVVYDKQGNPKGIIIPTKKEDCKDNIDRAFADVFSKYL